MMGACNNTVVAVDVLCLRVAPSRPSRFSERRGHQCPWTTSYPCRRARSRAPELGEYAKGEVEAQRRLEGGPILTIGAEARLAEPGLINCFSSGPLSPVGDDH